MLFVRPTNLGREKELRIYKILERVQFKNPFPDVKKDTASGKASGSRECTVTNSDGTVTRGTKVNGAWQGPFTKTYPDGGRWEGTYVNGKADGKLSYVCKSGERLDGEWHNGSWNGPGTYYSREGVLRGTWKDGEVEGDAVYTYGDGSEYVGGIRKFQRNGAGTILFPGGAKLKGTFEADRAAGPVEITFPNGDTYKGTWQGGISGKGEYFSGSCPNIRNIYYRGPWREGEMSCGREEQGRLSLRISSNTEYIYTGEWKNGDANGEGWLQCRRESLSAEPVCSGLFAGGALVSGEKSLEARTAEAYLQAAAKHIRKTVAQGLGTGRNRELL